MSQETADRPTRRTLLIGAGVTAGMAVTSGRAAATATHPDPVAVTVQMAVRFDLKQWDLLPDVFTTEVWIDYTGLVGGTPGTVAAADLVAGWRANLGHLAATQHLLGNQVAHVEGARARVTADFQATHRDGPLVGGRLYALGGRYDYRLTRTGREWRIGAVTMTPVWESGDRTVIGLPG
ncbi:MULTISPECIES: nuclear transport factor 2 family protein [Saccharothrix]|uniref:nuclear transport factor 2 family protein n=1 Tax=Saccharothrix TaxID=2071 RepID=UPI0009F9B4F3|nr:nuclear transport factor 2 family protein [Saccharothrix sp. CB00851]